MRPLQFASRYKVCSLTKPGGCARNRNFVLYFIKKGELKKRMRLYLVIITAILTLEAALGNYMFLTLKNVL